jgi:electron transfer flavoprotein beta subunit
MTSRGGQHIIAAAIPDDLFQHSKEETLKFVVCVKQVPDTAAKVTVENGRVTWGDAPLVINPWDEYAVEAALLQKEAYGGSITAITMGDENSKEALKHALAMGCDEAVIVSDPALTSVDTLVASHVLAAAIKKIAGSEPVTIAFFGRQAVDGDMGLTAAQTARVLGWPIVSLVSKLESLDEAGGKVKVERAIEEGKQTLEAKLPVVMSIAKDIGEPRYPSFMGIRKASRANIPAWSLADLGITAPQAVVSWPEVSNPPKREVVCEFITGSTPQEVADQLADKILSEKVL